MTPEHKVGLIRLGIKSITGILLCSLGIYAETLGIPGMWFCFGLATLVIVF